MRCIWIGISMYALRDAICFNQEEMANELGLSVSEYSQMERGDRELPSWIFARLDIMYEQYGPAIAKATAEPKFDIRKAIAETRTRGSQTALAKKLGVSVKTLHYWTIRNKNNRHHSRLHPAAKSVEKLLAKQQKPLSQRQMAKKLGVSPATICRWKNGSRNPQRRTLKRAERMAADVK